MSVIELYWWNLNSPFALNSLRRQSFCDEVIEFPHFSSFLCWSCFLGLPLLFPTPSTLPHPPLPNHYFQPILCFIPTFSKLADGDLFEFQVFGTPTAKVPWRKFYTSIWRLREIRAYRNRQYLGSMVNKWKLWTERERSKIRCLGILYSSPLYNDH